MVAANESLSREVDDSPKIGGQVSTPLSTTTTTITTMPPPPSVGKRISAPSLKPRALTLQTVELQHERRRVVDRELISPASPHKSGPRGVLKPHRQGPSRANTEPFPSAPDSNNVATPATSLPSALSESPPLCVGSILPNTKIAHPKPIAIPISACTSLSINTSVPIADQSIRSGAPIGNVAQLEATAERLSTGTSSIGDAIRELHGELKRSDSRRSSSRAASVRASGDDPFTNVPPVPPLSRHLSSASSILSTNIAARQGGYSPAGFVMSPSHSLTGRLRSGSKNSSGRPEIDFEPPTLSRHGPGKASVRSARSAKMSLAEISESEPISLTKAAMDAADAAPPIDADSPGENAYNSTPSPEQGEDHATDNAQSSKPTDKVSEPPAPQDESKTHNADRPNERPSSSHSYSTFQQAEDAFNDFDGVHCEEEHHENSHHTDETTMAEEHAEGAAEAHDVPDAVPRTRRTDRVRPQSYIDPGSGQQMLFYPARVPAMLNLPPKLSNKPKGPDINNRRSQVLSAMMDPELDFDMQDPEAQAEQQAPMRDSWLPDPLAGNRQSFIALSTDAGLIDPKENDEVEKPEDQAQPEPETQHLRRPQKIGRNKADNRKSRLAANLPPQLRASAFFDLPSTSPTVETKDGSAMATLDSMLDASMTAPVNAFTNHTFAGNLGPETYGKEKKQRPKSSAATSLQPPSPHKEPKKRASFLWFKRRNSDAKSEAKTEGDASALGRVNGETDDPETRGLASRDGDSSSQYRDENDPNRDPNDEDQTESEEDEQLTGPPTTLLAELQMRKQQQKQRTAPISRMFHNGEMHATLLQMDAVAEVERKHRKNKRVNLAWEAPDAHHDQNGSDDEDVPLAIIAAKHQGAKNMADLERPMGLMERRDMEDNEPLSHRRARLQGNDALPPPLAKRQSVATLSAHLAGPFNRIQPHSPGLSATTPEPPEEEIEDETLGDRKRRLESKELPKARPVSSAFSAELLSQFGDLDERTKPSTADDKSKENTEAVAGGGEETLGQRRRRLQAERQAREVEMSHNALTGPDPGPVINRRLSMADMLTAHPKKEKDPSREERQRLQKDSIITRERDAKMAAMRQQMPTSLSGPTAASSGGFRGGAYNDGRGGGQTQRLPGAMSTPTLMTQAFPNRSSVAISSFGMPQQSGYAGNNPYGGANASMNNLNRMTMNPYAQSSMQQTLPLQSQLPVNTSSMTRVEQWRHGVVP